MENDITAIFERTVYSGIYFLRIFILNVFIIKILLTNLIISIHREHASNV